MPEKHSFSSLTHEGGPSCDVVRTQLSPLIDAVLNEQETSILRLHLSTCASCRREEQLLAGADRMLKSHQVQTVPTRVWGLIEERLCREGLIRDGKVIPFPGGLKFRSATLLHPLTVGAFLSLAASGGLLMGVSLPALVLLGVGLGSLVGCVLITRGDRSMILGRFTLRPVVVTVPFSIVNLAALLLAGPSVSGVAAYSLGAAAALGGTLYARKKVA